MLHVEPAWSSGYWTRSRPDGQAGQGGEGRLEGGSRRTGTHPGACLL